MFTERLNESLGIEISRKTRQTKISKLVAIARPLRF